MTKILARHASPDNYTDLAVLDSAPAFIVVRLNSRGQIITRIGTRTDETSARHLANEVWLADAGRGALAARSDTDD